MWRSDGGASGGGNARVMIDGVSDSRIRFGRPFNLRSSHMRSWLSDSVIQGVTLAVALLVTAVPSAQAPAYRAPRTADGKPNLNGIWQALNTADWDLQGHAAAKGPVASLGAAFAVPPGLSVVDGAAVPYLPAAAGK